MTKRVSLEFPHQAADRLDALKVKTEATSYAEVINNALQLYEWAIDMGGQNVRMIVSKDDGTTEIVRLFKPVE